VNENDDDDADDDDDDDDDASDDDGRNPNGLGCQTRFLVARPLLLPRPRPAPALALVGGRAARCGVVSAGIAIAFSASVIALISRAMLCGVSTICVRAVLRARCWVVGAAPAGLADASSSLSANSINAFRVRAL
jgi:hypothetical protein